MIISGEPERFQRIVTICGPSGAGKSQLAKATAALLGEDRASRVATDNFFVPRPAQMTMAEFVRLPLQYDWGLLRQRLALPFGTPMTTPECDFTAFTRLKDEGGYPFTVRPIMLLDAMVPYPDADFRIRIDLPNAVRQTRIVERDIRWHANVADRFAQLDATWASARPETIVPDLVVDGGLSIAENAAMLAAFIEKRITAGRVAPTVER